MKVLVTGANGFVGRAIVKELLANEVEAAVLVNRDSEFNDFGRIDNVLRADITDITDFQNFKNLGRLGKIDIIIHSAGLAHQFGRTEKRDFWKVNVVGTENVAKLAIALQVKHLILISSVSVYGVQQVNKKKGNSKSGKYDVAGISEDGDCQPPGFYGQSKLESEQVARRICEKNQIILTILRLATVIGEEDKGNVARLIKTIDARRFFWIGRGENLKSLIYKGDAAKACLRVLRRSDGGTEIFNVTAESLKMNEIVSEIEKHLDRKIPKFSIPLEIFLKIFSLNTNLLKLKKVNDLAATLNKWISEDVFNGDKFKRQYNFQAETSIREGLRRQVESYKSEKVKK